MSACHYLKISFWATLLGIVVCALISMQTRVSDEGISRLNVDERRRIVKRLFSSSASDGKRRIECRRRETFSNGPPTSINTGHYTCRGYSCLVPWLLQNRTSQLEGVSSLSCHAAMLLCIFVSSTVANFLATSVRVSEHALLNSVWRTATSSSNKAPRSKPLRTFGLYIYVYWIDDETTMDDEMAYRRAGAWKINTSRSVSVICNVSNVSLDCTIKR